MSLRTPEHQKIQQAPYGTTRDGYPIIGYTEMGVPIISATPISVSEAEPGIGDKLKSFYRNNRLASAALAMTLVMGAGSIALDVVGKDTQPQVVSVDDVASKKANKMKDDTGEIIIPLPTDIPTSKPTPEPSPEPTKEPSPSSTSVPNAAKTKLVSYDDASVDFNVATFNIRHSTDRNWRKRLELSLSTIAANNVAVWGGQEMRPNQQTMIHNVMDKVEEGKAPKWYKGEHYNIYPNSPNGREFSPNTVLYSDDFKIVKKDGIPFTYFGGARKEAPFITLQHKSTGTLLRFGSGHDPADARGEADEYRARNANGYVNFFKPKLPTFENRLSENAIATLFVADFNSGFDLKYGNNNTLNNNRNLSVYCKLTREGRMFNAYDVANDVKHKANCPSRSGAHGLNTIDHIYGSYDVKFKNYKWIAGGYNRNGSDHPLIVTRASIPRKG